MEEIAPLSGEKLLKINDQMLKSICYIDLGNMKGTGFLCKIPFPDNNNLLSALITCNHILKEEYLYSNKNILIFTNNMNEKREIFIEDRIIYTNKEYDITIIEIKSEKDHLYNFLELEEFGKNLEGLSVYLLQYVKEGDCLVSFGNIKAIKEKNIIYNCWTSFGSAGGPIISSLNYKVIGVHFGAYMDNHEKKKKFKLGTLLSKVIPDFQKVKK